MYTIYAVTYDWGLFVTSILSQFLFNVFKIHENISYPLNTFHNSTYQFIKYKHSNSSLLTPKNLTIVFFYLKWIVFSQIKAYIYVHFSFNNLHERNYLHGNKLQDMLQCILLLVTMLFRSLQNKRGLHVK